MENGEISEMTLSMSSTEAKQVGYKHLLSPCVGTLWQSSSWIRETATQSTGHVGTNREDAEWSHTAQIDMPSFFLPRSLIENKSLAILLSVTHSQKRWFMNTWCSMALTILLLWRTILRKTASCMKESAWTKLPRCFPWSINISAREIPRLFL